MKVELIDLRARYREEKKDILKLINKVLTKGNLILTDEVKKFEKSICSYTGAKYCLGLNSGTDALMMSLWSCNIKKGDEVITSPLSFVATANSIIHVGAKPVFADIDLETYNISKKEILKKINKKTKAIIPVHLFGNPFDIRDLKQEIGDKNIKIIEDCAQSFGSGINCQRVGSIGDIGCFSFYPTKNLGCYGDGGLITTNSEEICQDIKKLKMYKTLSISGSSERVSV